jgi:sulfopyruvate decarboxylase TPP-binding subunit
MTGVSAAKTVPILKDLGISHVVTIPDAESRHLFDALTGDSEIEVISPTREGEGLALAAGLWVGGRKPLVILQNTGLMEAGDALRGCGIGPSIPLLLLVGWRGYAGAIAGQLPMDSAYPFTEPLLDAWQVPHWRLMSDDELPVLVEMDRVASATSKPAAVLFGGAFVP